MNIKLTKTERLLLCGGLIGMASLMLQACDIMAKEDGDTRDRICGKLGKRGSRSRHTGVQGGRII